MNQNRKQVLIKSQRLILASSRAPQKALITECLQSNVTMVTYKYETCTLDDILDKIKNALKHVKVETIAFLMHCSETEIFICFPGSKVLGLQSSQSDVSIRNFFQHLVSSFINKLASNCRLDFLNASPALHVNGGLIAHNLELLLNLPVGMSKDLLGEDVQMIWSNLDPNYGQTLGELYFRTHILREKLQAENSGRHKLDGYEKIRTVGKGAFGTAILYRKLTDDSLVVIKEVNIIDLAAAERQLALNEVQVLSRLDHPNIISYLGSFERDGVLMIEMEYADGGTLAQMLSQRSIRLSEKEILMLFRQIVAAIRYMHDNNILHRDLKTANVFLNKDNTIKVGDFGISKMMSTRGQAQTVLGTPYYISPEMCEGKQYDQKSDIWALGCILYEMACLQKTFEGSNLPALVNKIMKGQFQPIPGAYSPGFKQLVHDLLQRDPTFRPTAAEILDIRIPQLLNSLVEDQGGDWFLEHRESIPNIDPMTNRSAKPQRSVLYELKTFETAVSITPIQLPPRSRVKELSYSNTHIIALTTELLVYTWGEGKKGQLGHGDTEPWKQNPECVEILRGKSITMVGAGDGYSVFVSDSGMLMTCGDGTFGCLGHGDWNSSTRPKLIEKLMSVDAAMIACGPHHVAILSGEGDLYAWGRGDGGRLGLGSEEDCCSPTKVSLPGEIVLRRVRCGGDGTAAITTDGTLYMCGRNTNNKLGISDSRRLLATNNKGDDKIYTLSKVRRLGYKVADVSLGMSHTAVLTESGHIITFGRNDEGQLGRGHSRSAQTGPALVKTMADKVATIVKCGPTYTVVGTMENAVYFWGTRYGPINNQDSTLFNHEVSGAWSQSQMRYQDKLFSSQAGTNYSNILNASNLISTQPTETILQPQEVLALYASPKQVAKRETVSLAGLYPLRYSLLVLVDTTVPLVRLQSPSQQGMSSTSSSEDSTSEEDDDDSPHGSQEALFDSMGPVPAWMRAELAKSENAWRPFN